jgi:hypothetical protein
MTSSQYSDNPEKGKQNTVIFSEIAAAALRIAHSLLKSRLPDGRREGDEWSARNPTRADAQPGSFKVNLKTGAWADFATTNKGGDLISLWAYLYGLSQIEAARMLAAELGIPIEPGAPRGLTLEAYSLAKKLPIEFLAKLGLETIANPYRSNAMALAIPYYRGDGVLFRKRIRQTLHKQPDGKDKRMLWDKRDDKPGAILYGLEQLPARGLCLVLLVEGESDCHTLWHRERDAVGVPGAGNYSPARDDKELDGFEIIALIEPDGGGEALIKKLAASKLRKSIRLARLNGFKDVSELWLRAPERFDEVLDAAIADAEPLEELLRRSPELDTRKEKPAKDKPPRKSGALDDDDKKPTQADALVRLASEACTFFKSPDDTAYAAIEIDGHRETWAIRSRGFKQWLIYRYFTETGRAPNSDALNQAQATVSAMAQFGGVEAKVFIRTAERDGKLYVDLADKDWRAVEIDACGWRVVERPPVNFTRPRGMLSLPDPEGGGSIDDLRPFLNLREEGDFVMVVAWLLAALRPTGPYPLIALAGAPGAAKSTSAKILRGLVDPNASSLRSVPKDERDVFIAASNSAMLVLDNLSSIPAWLSDALCRVATGGGFSTRALHTDGDEMLFDVVRPVIITGVGDVIARADLADRALTVTLTSVTDEVRRTEGGFMPAFERARPRILGALFDAMVLGLAELPNVKLKRLPRMADFIVWTRACEGRFWTPGTIQEVFNRNLTDAAEAVIESDAVALAVLAYLKANPEPWEGPTSEAYARLAPFAPEGSIRDKRFPLAPAALTNRLRLAQPALAKRGVFLDWRRAHEGKRLTAIWQAGQPRPISEPSERPR